MFENCGKPWKDKQQLNTFSSENDENSSYFWPHWHIWNADFAPFNAHHLICMPLSLLLFLLLLAVAAMIVHARLRNKLAFLPFRYKTKPTRTKIHTKHIFYVYAQKNNHLKRGKETEINIMHTIHVHRGNHASRKFYSCFVASAFLYSTAYRKSCMNADTTSHFTLYVFKTLLLNKFFFSLNSLSYKFSIIFLNWCSTIEWLPFTSLKQKTLINTAQNAHVSSYLICM